MGGSMSGVEKIPIDLKITDLVELTGTREGLSSKPFEGLPPNFQELERVVKACRAVLPTWSLLEGFIFTNGKEVLNIATDKEGITQNVSQALRCDFDPEARWPSAECNTLLFFMIYQKLPWYERFLRIFERIEILPESDTDSFYKYVEMKEEPEVLKAQLSRAQEEVARQRGRGELTLMGPFYFYYLVCDQWGELRWVGASSIK